MIQLLNKLKLSGFWQRLIRWVSSVVLVAGILLLVQADLLPLAILLAVSSKWQIFLGGPRLWWHSLRENGSDLVIIGSTLTLLEFYLGDSILQLIVAGLYLSWQLLIKPLDGQLGKALQAGIALVVGVGVAALFTSVISLTGLIVIVWLVGLIASDHFLQQIADDAPRLLLSFTTALLFSQVAWILGRWLIIYPFFSGRILIPQLALVVGTLGYIFGHIYYDHHKKILGRRRLYGYMSLLSLIVIGLIIGTEWVTLL